MFSSFVICLLLFFISLDLVHEGGLPEQRGPGTWQQASLTAFHGGSISLRIQAGCGGALL